MPKGRDRDSKSAEKESFRFSAKDFVLKKSHMEIDGNSRVNLEGSKGVLEYSTECIRVSVDAFVVSFSGRGLTLKCISPTALVIEGYILNIDFSD